MSNPANIRLLDNTLSTINKMLYYVRTGSQEITTTGLELLENQVENHGVTELQDSLVELLKAEQRINAFSNSINQLKTKWQDGQLDDSVDIVQVLEDCLKEEDTKYDESDIWDHEFMKNFVDQMGQADSSVQLSHGANASETSDMVIRDARTVKKCPITQSDIEEPYRDVVCGHTFEKSAILAYVKQYQRKRKNAKCPFQGCTNAIQNANLQPDTSIRRGTQSKRRGEGSSLE